MVRNHRWDLRLRGYQLLGVVCLLVGACGGDGNNDLRELMEQMGDAEKAYKQRLPHVHLFHMSVETMFPDPQVRALAQAAGDGEIEEMDRLVNNGVDVHARGKQNATPLFWALRNRNLPGFMRLLELGADPNLSFQPDGEIPSSEATVMHLAMRPPTTAFLEAALEHGGNPNLVAGSQQDTPIFSAIIYGNKVAMALLLAAGADIDARDVIGRTPLDVAAVVQEFEIVYLLLTRGADYTVTDKYGYGPLHGIARGQQLLSGVPDHPEAPWLAKVIAWLEERGVELPPPPGPVS